MTNVGLELLQTILNVNETVKKLGTVEIAFSTIAIRAIEGHRLCKEQSDVIRDNLLAGGLTVKTTERDSYSVTRTYSVPGLEHVSICTYHKPSEQDLLEALREKKKKAALELEELEKKLLQEQSALQGVAGE